MTMNDHWELILLLWILGPILVGGFGYVLISEWLLWRGTRHWLRTHFPAPCHRDPIYGPADPSRREARPNLRVVR